MIFKELELEEKRHAKERDRLVSEIRQAILALPDNPRIRRLPGSPRVFTMNCKDLGSNWSVQHHDFKFQYEKVADEIGKAKDPAGRLRSIMDAGRINLGKASSLRHGHVVALHPDVIAALRRLADGEAN